MFMLISCWKREVFFSVFCPDQLVANDISGPPTLLPVDTEAAVVDARMSRLNIFHQAQRDILIQEWLFIQGKSYMYSSSMLAASLCPFFR